MLFFFIEQGQPEKEKHTLKLLKYSKIHTYTLDIVQNSSLVCISLHMSTNDINTLINGNEEWYKDNMQAYQLNKILLLFSMRNYN